MVILDRTYQLETMIVADIVRTITANNAVTVVNLKCHFVWPHTATITGK